MFYGGTTRQNGPPYALHAMRMNGRSQSQRFGLSTRGVELLLAQCWTSTIANTLGSKYLDDIGALLFHLAHVLANLIRTTGIFIDRHDRGQNSRARHLTPFHPFTQRLICRRPQTLDCRYSI